MRLFTAFDFPSEVARAIALVQQDLADLPFKRWQPVSTLHLTVHFLGEVAPETLPELETALYEACAGFGEFLLQLGSLGAFPSLDRPRTLWLGVDGEVERLLALEARLRPQVAATGIALDHREYRPHITLARDPDGRVTIPPSRVSERRGLVWQAKELILFQSQLQRGGARHTPLARFPLAEPPAPPPP